MKNPEVLFIDAANNSEILREMTNEEYQERLAEIATYQDIEDKKNLEAEAKATAKAALLEKLGITSEEASLLLS